MTDKITTHYTVRRYCNGKLVDETCAYPTVSEARERMLKLAHECWFARVACLAGLPAERATLRHDTGWPYFTSIEGTSGADVDFQLYAHGGMEP